MEWERKIITAFSGCVSVIVCLSGMVQKSRSQRSERENSIVQTVKSKQFKAMCRWQIWCEQLLECRCVCVCVFQTRTRWTGMDRWWKKVCVCVSCSICRSYESYIQAAEKDRKKRGEKCQMYISCKVIFSRLPSRFSSLQLKTYLLTTSLTGSNRIFLLLLLKQH